VQPNPLSPNAIRFGLFEADLATGELRRRGRKIPLQDQPFRVLNLLLLHPGELVSREEFQRTLWPADTFVEFDEGLNKAIQKLRQALDDSSDNPRFIETLPRRGYRFIAPVELPAADPSLPRLEKGREAVLESASDSAILAHVIKRHKKAAMGSVAVVAALVAVTFFLPRPPKASAELTLKRLTFNSSENPIYWPVISPDGKYLAYSDRAGIHVKLLSTGEERLIPRPAGVPASASWFVASWFPDGTQLLADVQEPGGHMSIWTVSLLAPAPRELRDGALGLGSPDGTRIAFSPSEAFLGEIWVMDSQGRNQQKVLAFGENEWLRIVRWSPDGQRLVYVRERRIADRSQYSIETCDLNGASQTVVLSADPGPEVQDVLWLPEGRIVYARHESHDSLDDNLWQIGIDNRTGSPTSKPKRITQWAGSFLYHFSASADGKRLALLKTTSQSQVYLGELAAGGTRMNPPRRLTNDETFDQPSAWTPDSKAVLFVSNRNGTWGIYKQRLGQETAEAVVTGPQDMLYPRLSADGASILFLERPITPAKPAPTLRLMRIPASGGVPQFVLETRNFLEFRCARAPASLCVIFETSQNRKQMTITAFDPLKGRGNVLRTIENDPLHTYDQQEISPDGSTLAISRSGEPEIRIRLLSLSGGADREIKVKGWPNITGLDRSPDGKGFYCGSSSPQGHSLLYVDLKGNVRVLWHYKGGGNAIWGMPSPDGRYLAILGEVINSNVWMIEGF
jgi:Tol biopolymer transport system component/DNA-binding winged helix-turn-helix (wHTH) protein